MKITNNTILLTGATSGIGLALLRDLYNDNKIIVTFRKQANFDQIKKEFPNITGIHCNLEDLISVKSLIEKCSAEFPSLNVIINNAGVQNNYLFSKEEEAYSKIKDEITINLVSPLFLIYGLLPILLNKDSSAIVNISSGLAFSPKKSAPVYCGTKAAIHNFTKALRYQLEDTNVKVFEIIPPLVDTPLAAKSTRKKISPGRLADEFLKDFQNDKLESNIGKIKLLRIIHRLLPKTADKLLKNG